MSLRHVKAREYTRKYQGQLAPCRYCGSADIHVCSDRNLIPGKYSWTVCCSTRGCDYSNDVSISKAVKKWNDRHGGMENSKV